jgi:hypothetical protein
MISNHTRIQCLNFHIRLRNNIRKFLQHLKEWKRNLEYDIMSLYFTASYMKLTQNTSKSEGVNKYLSCREYGNVLQLMFITMTPVLTCGSDKRKNTHSNFKILKSKHIYEIYILLSF